MMSETRQRSSYQVHIKFVEVDSGARDVDVDVLYVYCIVCRRRE